MNNEIGATIISIGMLIFFFIGLPLYGLIDDKMQKNHELRKLGILKPKTKSRTTTKTETDYNEKLKYQLKFWLINIVAIIIICLICKLFGFGISDIVDLIK